MQVQKVHYRRIEKYVILPKVILWNVLQLKKNKWPRRLRQMTLNKTLLYRDLLSKFPGGMDERWILALQVWNIWKNTIINVTTWGRASDRRGDTGEHSILCLCIWTVKPDGVCCWLCGSRRAEKGSLKSTSLQVCYKCVRTFLWIN